MKQLIVLCAIFILLAAMLIQIPLETINYEKRHAILFYINNAKEMAKQEGYYTDEILNTLKNSISKKMNIKDSDIIIVATQTPKYRKNQFDEREIIYLRVSVPFSNIIAAPSLYGIDKSGNAGYFIVEEATVSERLLR